jgi:hypothetical protein
VELVEIIILAGGRAADRRLGRWGGLNKSIKTE